VHIPRTVSVLGDHMLISGCGPAQRIKLLFNRSSVDSTFTLARVDIRPMIMQSNGFYSVEKCFTTQLIIHDNLVNSGCHTTSVVPVFTRPKVTQESWLLDAQASDLDLPWVSDEKHFKAIENLSVSGVLKFMRNRCPRYSGPIFPISTKSQNLAGTKLSEATKILASLHGRKLLILDINGICSDGHSRPVRGIKKMISFARFCKYTVIFWSSYGLFTDENPFVTMGDYFFDRQYCAPASKHSHEFEVTKGEFSLPSRCYKDIIIVDDHKQVWTGFKHPEQRMLMDAPTYGSHEAKVSRTPVSVLQLPLKIIKIKEPSFFNQLDEPYWFSDVIDRIMDMSEEAQIYCDDLGILDTESGLYTLSHWQDPHKLHLTEVQNRELLEDLDREEAYELAMEGSGEISR